MNIKRENIFSHCIIISNDYNHLLIGKVIMIYLITRQVWPHGELYEHKEDSEENWNHFPEDKYDNIKKKLAEKLHNGWRSALPPGYRK